MCSVCNGYPGCPCCSPDPKIEECNECGGTGQIEEFGEFYECSKCDGTGQIVEE